MIKQISGKTVRQYEAMSTRAVSVSSVRYVTLHVCVCDVTARVGRQTSVTAAAAAARVIATDGHNTQLVPAGLAERQRRTNSSEKIYWPSLSNHYSPPVTSASWQRRPKIASGQRTGPRPLSRSPHANCGVYYDITKRGAHHRVAQCPSTCCRRRNDLAQPAEAAVEKIMFHQAVRRSTRDWDTGSSFAVNTICAERFYRFL